MQALDEGWSVKWFCVLAMYEGIVTVYSGEWAKVATLIDFHLEEGGVR